MTEAVIPFIVPLTFSKNSGKGLKHLIQPSYFFRSKNFWQIWQVVLKGLLYYYDNSCNNLPFEIIP